MPDLSNPGIVRNVARWWRETRAAHGVIASLGLLAGLAGQFLLDSLPAQRRRRYGDVDYDWEHRVDTTSATVDWHERLIGLLNSPYQPTDPALFHEMLAALEIDFRNFIFVDIGSGKGRTLLMASQYPFRRVIGVELLPGLNRVAQENIRKYKNDCQQCFVLESICGDAREFVFPPEPTILFLFNPLPEAGLVQLRTNLEQSLRDHPRPVFVLYHNPVLEHVLEGGWLKKTRGTHQYSIFLSRDADL